MRRSPTPATAPPHAPTRWISTRTTTARLPTSSLRPRPRATRSSRACGSARRPSTPLAWSSASTATTGRRARVPGTTGWVAAERPSPAQPCDITGNVPQVLWPLLCDFATSVHGGEGPVNALTVMVEDTDIAYAIRSGSPEAENMLLNLLVAGGHHPGATGRGGRLARRVRLARADLQGTERPSGSPRRLHRKPPRGRCVRSGVRGSALPAHAPDTVVTEPVEKDSGARCIAELRQYRRG